METHDLHRGTLPGHAMLRNAGMLRQMVAGDEPWLAGRRSGRRCGSGWRRCGELIVALAAENTIDPDVLTLLGNVQMAMMALDAASREHKCDRCAEEPLLLGRTTSLLQPDKKFTTPHF